MEGQALQAAHLRQAQHRRSQQHRHVGLPRAYHPLLQPCQTGTPAHPPSTAVHMQTPLQQKHCNGPRTAAVHGVLPGCCLNTCRRDPGPRAQLSHAQRCRWGATLGVVWCGVVWRPAPGASPWAAGAQGDSVASRRRPQAAAAERGLRRREGGPAGRGAAHRVRPQPHRPHRPRQVRRRCAHRPCKVRRRCERVPCSSGVCCHVVNRQPACLLQVKAQISTAAHIHFCSPRGSLAAGRRNKPAFISHGGCASMPLGFWECVSGGAARREGCLRRPRGCRGAQGQLPVHAGATDCSGGPPGAQRPLSPHCHRQHPPPQRHACRHTGGAATRPPVCARIIARVARRILLQI